MRERVGKRLIYIVFVFILQELEFDNFNVTGLPYGMSAASPRVIIY
jgi:hypothetical protein